MKKFYTLFAGLIFMGGCSTLNQSESLSRVKQGMSKEQVLGIAGNPSRSDRSKGSDRWAYDIKDEQKRKTDTIEVYFSEGRVQYVGSENTFESQIKNPLPHHQKTNADSGFQDL